MYDIHPKISDQRKIAGKLTMTDVQSIGCKLGITSPRVLRKAKEYCQLVDIRSTGSNLSSLKMTGSCKTVVCLDLAASSSSFYIDKASAIKAAGTTKKSYIMCLKTIESILDIEEVKTVRDLAVQFGCTGATTLAQQILKRYIDNQSVRGDEMDFNTSLFQGASLCAACRKLKMKVDTSKVKEICAVKKSCFDTLVTEMEKLAEQIQEEKVSVVTKKRSSTFIEDVERKLNDIPEKQGRLSDDDDDDDNKENSKVDYQEWKRKILENAARAQKTS
ncbi:Origin of replication complex subunit 6 [Mactra antiquata]